MAKPTTSSDPNSDICPYDLNFFADKHGLSKETAEVILRSNGPSRTRCDYAAVAYLRFKRLKEARAKPPAMATRLMQSRRS
jgi:hypothetical protein